MESCIGYSLLLRVVVVVVLIASTASCQGQAPKANDPTPSISTNPPPQQGIVDLIADPLVPTPQQQAQIDRALAQYKHMLAIRLVPRPFLDAKPLFDLRIIRCKLSPTRILIAERMRVETDNSLGYPCYIWRGKFQNTGINFGNPEDNELRIYIESSSTVPSGFSLQSIHAFLTFTEQYEVLGSRTDSVWSVVHIDGSKLEGGPTDSGTVRPPTGNE
jgi:hypothetical protein